MLLRVHLSLKGPQSNVLSTALGLAFGAVLGDFRVTVVCIILLLLFQCTLLSPYFHCGHNPLRYNCA